ncbi:MAG: hypothetical protein MUE54_00875 [Anaerolineae bacterium]|nr:hypothetical protein [Anaerolineae bacterium]
MDTTFYICAIGWGEWRMVTLIQVVIYGLVVWLGCYLIARDLSSWRLRFAGLALLTYGLNVALMMLNVPDFWVLIGIFIPLILMLIPVYFVIIHAPPNSSKRLNPLFLLFTLFLAGSYLLLAIMPMFGNIWVLVISADLLMLGTIIAVWDAMDAGESLLPDMLRSFTSTFLMSVIVAGQVVIITPNITDSTILLILALITTVIMIIVFDTLIQNRIDSVIFSRFPHIRQQRQQQRVIETITIRRAEHPVLDDETEFTRYTRRALSHYGDLSKLATNPLTQLTIIEHRLNQRNAPDDSLERAKELKNLLHESILRLKPNGAEFGTSDEWRYYNALYFPYVAGLKPYSIRAMNEDKTHHEVLTWFRSQVPERTLYNWQNAAASLVAKDLRERTN